MLGLYDIFKNQDHLVSNDRILSEKWIKMMWMEKWPNWRYHTSICPKGLRKKQTKSQSGELVWGQDLKQGPLKYEARVTTI